ncbi:serine proteinase stubble-like isoform X2 [Ixodes scapularis]
MIRACLILALATSAFAGYVNGGYGLGLGYGLGYGHALGYGHTLGYGHGLGYGLGLGYGHGLGFTHGLGYGHGLAYGHGLSYGGLSVAAPAVARTVSYAAPAVTKVAAIHAAPAVATYATAPAVTRVATYAAAPVATYAAPAFTKVAAVHAAPAVATYATAPAVTRVATYAAAPVATYAAAPVATVAAAPVVTRTVATSHVVAPVVGAYHAAPAVTTVAHAPAVATVAHAPALGYGYGVGHLGYGLGHYGYGHGLASYGLNYGYGLGTFGDYTTLLRKKKCKRQTTVENFIVVIGDQNIRVVDPTEERIGIQEIIIHPQYNKSLIRFDYAILRLNKTLNFTGQEKRLMPICLPTPDQEFDGQNCTATGWGLTKDRSEGGNAANPELLKVDMPIVPFNVCRAIYRKKLPQIPVIRSAMICAGYAQGGKAACTVSDGICPKESYAACTLRDTLSGKE